MKRLLFITLIFLIGCTTTTSLLNEFEPDVQMQLKEKFLDKEGNLTRFRNNILVYINKDIASEDSVFLANITEEINGLVENYSVSLTPVMSTASIIFHTDDNIPDGKIVSRKNSTSWILQSFIALNLNNAIDREKMLYYYYMRALTDFKKDYTTPENPVPGFVFDEENYQNITFHPLDKKMIKAIYSKKTINLQNNNNIQNNINREITRSIFLYLPYALCFLLIIVMFQKGFFKRHYYRFWPFFCQGFLVIITFLFTFTIAILIFNYARAQIIWKKDFELFFIMFCQAIMLILMVYVIERPLLKDNDSLLLRVAIPFFSTFISMLFISFVFRLLPIMHNNTFNGSMPYTFICIRCLYIYISIQSENQIKKKDLELARLGELHKQAELRSLQSKINPHFLYNSLNSIASLASSDPVKTEKMAVALSDFFKYSLNKEKKEMVTLKEEMESIETYLSIEKVRFGDRLNYSIVLPKELEDMEIPQFIIQPVVENAMKHGISKRVNEGILKVEIFRNLNQLEIRIFDNGPDFPNEPVSGYGIQSIQEKLQIIYQDKAYMKWENGIDKHMLIVLPVK